MPKRISNRPADVNQAAHLMVERSTSELEAAPAKKPHKVTKAEISRIMSAMGKYANSGFGFSLAMTVFPLFDFVC